MKFVKWIAAIVSVCTLLSFVDKDYVGFGYGVGDKTPDVWLTEGAGEGSLRTDSLSGQYVLLSFWVSHDASSRMSNVALHRALKALPENDVQMVSISFDPYRSVFVETVACDEIDPEVCFVDLKAEGSRLYRRFGLKRGVQNYLLDRRGVIIAKNVRAEELAAYIK